jgi:hypothetical protein
MDLEKALKFLLDLIHNGDRLMEVEELKLIIYDIRKGIPLDKIH